MSSQLEGRVGEGTDRRMDGGMISGWFDRKMGGGMDEGMGGPLNE